MMHSLPRLPDLRHADSDQRHANLPRCFRGGRTAFGYRNAQALAFVACGLLVGLTSGCGNVTMPADPPPNIQLVGEIRGGAGQSGTAGTEAAVSTGTGWATLKGRFVYDGDPPSLPRLPVNKDTGVCGTSAPNESLVVDPANKGIANVLIYARRVSRTNPDAAREAEPFDQKNCIFLSHVYGIQVKKPMLVKNSDTVGHNASMSAAGNIPFNPTLAPGQDATYQFTRQLSTPAELTCSIHPWMKAYVIARDDPYFAVTGPDGSFEIPLLPAGEAIEFQVWHERAPGGNLEARSDWSRGRFTLTLPADGTETLDVLVPPGAFQ